MAADEFTKPKAGNEFIVVHLKLHNAGSGEENYNPFDFHVKSGAGNITNKVRRIEPNFVDDSSTHKYINTRNRIQRQETEAEIASTEQDSTVTIHIMENPLTAQNFATIISALTDLHTKCWLIQQGRLNDLIEYTQTHNPHFTKEANLIIVKLTHNSPAEIKLDVGVREVAEALKIGIDCIAQAPLRHEEAKIRNQADALDIKLKELDAQAVHADKEQARQIEAEKAKMIKEKNST